MKHKVRIHVADKKENSSEVLCSAKRRISQRLFKLFFGDFSEVLLLKPGKTVAEVEICEQESEPQIQSKGDKGYEG